MRLNRRLTFSEELGNRREKINNFKGERKPITNV